MRPKTVVSVDFCEAAVQLTLRDVLHEDRRSGQRARVSDAAAHDSRTDDGDLPNFV